ncbi:hypothetical protein [Chitinophaga filiformis]|uniref:Uncharacterized protein n=1 Tax=Chitinophaga filiformis TaxID=104663 RepID=A0A1G7NW79_CHIFI|nr:hypothetical protein [Chitinophaga filiformis]SDF78305.1 hypothetical protein SAMN04488121_102968 [Chitinophaga filiformis]
MLTFTKYLGIAFTLAGIPLLVADYLHVGSELLLITGLFLIFFGKEKVEDERAQKLRSEALMISFAVAYIADVAITYLYNGQGLIFSSHQPRYFVVVVLSLSIIIYYVKTFATGYSK